MSSAGCLGPIAGVPGEDNMSRRAGFQPNGFISCSHPFQQASEQNRYSVLRTYAHRQSCNLSGATVLPHLIKAQRYKDDTGNCTARAGALDCFRTERGLIQHSGGRSERGLVQQFKFMRYVVFTCIYTWKPHIQ